MNQKYLTLVSRIRDEITDMRLIVKRIQDGWKCASQSGDDLFLDSVALNLHNFYTALERVFELIAATIDQVKPQGENWHQKLLHQISTEVDRVRPPVISRETSNALDEYRGFRHVVRNIYSFNLSAAKIDPLVKKLPDLFNTIEKELEDFIYFLEIRAKKE